MIDARLQGEGKHGKGCWDESGRRVVELGSKLVGSAMK